MADKRRGLGRGLGALIPNAPTGDSRPVDVFFPGAGHPRPGTVVADPWDVPGSASTDPDLQPEPAEEEPEHPSAPDVVHGDPLEPALPDASPDQESRAVTVSPAGTELSAGTGAAEAGANENDSHEDADEAVPVPTSAEDLVPVPGVRYAEVPVGAVRPNPRQPRTVFDQDELAELVSSIREVGVLQPIVVRPVGTGSDGTPQLELIMGERRWRASQAAGLATVPAIVRETDDADLLRDALLENLHRSQLNPLEEAAAYQQLLDDFGCTHDELAQRIHRSRPQISNTLRLLKLPPLVQRRVAAGVLSAGHARALLGLPDAAAMERLAQRIVAEGLSVRATEEIVMLGGDPAARTPVRRHTGGSDPALEELASRLSDRLDTRVKIDMGRSKGRLTVEFASVEDLNRILGTLSPEDPNLQA